MTASRIAESPAALECWPHSSLPSAACVPAFGDVTGMDRRCTAYRKITVQASSPPGHTNSPECMIVAPLVSAGRLSQIAFWRRQRFQLVEVNRHPQKFPAVARRAGQLPLSATDSWGVVQFRS